MKFLRREIGVLPCEHMHCFRLSHMFMHMLLTNTLYSIIRGDYSGWLWCSVGIRGDDLIGDLVPHAYRCRVKAHCMKLIMSHNCLCN